MSILVRRVNLGMWKDYCASAACRRPLISHLFKYPKYSAPGDVITNELNTTGDALSFWKISDESEIEDALLAMCTGTSQSNIGTVHYLLFDERELKSRGIQVVQSSNDANTAVTELKKLHHNIVNVDYLTLGRLQDMIVDKIRADKSQCKTKAKIKPIVKQAIANEKIDFTILSNDYIRHLRDDFKDLRNVIPEIKTNSIICPNCASVISLPLLR